MKRLLLCPLVLCASSPLHALDKTSISIGGGATVPVGEYGRDSNAGFHFAGSVGIPTRLGGCPVLLEALFSKTDSVFGYGQHTQVVGGTVGFSYVLLRGRTVRPYLTAGAGFHDVAVSWIPPSLPYPGAAPASLETRHETRPGFAIGGGASIDVGKAQLFLEGRYIVVLTHDGSTGFVPVTIGVRFGGRR